MGRLLFLQPNRFWVTYPTNIIKILVTSYWQLVTNWCFWVTNWHYYVTNWHYYGNWKLATGNCQLATGNSQLLCVFTTLTCYEEQRRAWDFSHPYTPFPGGRFDNGSIRFWSDPVETVLVSQVKRFARWVGPLCYH